ncbi:hypothetical protein ACOMHN_015282 [Nucella lapillus]
MEESLSHSRAKKRGTDFLSFDKFDAFQGGEGNGKEHKQPVVPLPPGADFGEKQDSENALQVNLPKSKAPYAVFTKGVSGNFEPEPKPKTYKPGEDGKPVHTSMEEKMKADETVREFGFNMLISDKIPMDRSVPDTRMEECKYWHYPEELPTASVILVFYDEGWSTLLRTVHSVINTSPAPAARGRAR